MRLNQFLRGLAPILAVAMAAGVAGCDSSDVSINGEHGKKLAELDLSGAAPNELVMFGPDEVQMTQGDKLAITVDGDPAAVDRLRFTLKDGTLGILREGKVFSGDVKVAVVHVTLPAPRELAAMEKTDEPSALQKILAILNEHAPKYYAEAAATV